MFTQPTPVKNEEKRRESLRNIHVDARVTATQKPSNPLPIPSNQDVPSGSISPCSSGYDTSPVSSSRSISSSPPKDDQERSLNESFSSSSSDSSKAPSDDASDDEVEFKELDEDVFQEEAKKPIDASKWSVFTDSPGVGDGPFYINTSLYQKGVVVFSDRLEDDISEASLPFGNNRNFKFTTLGERESTVKSKTKSQLTSSTRIFSQLHLFSQGSSVEREEEAKKVVRTTLQSILPTRTYKDSDGQKVIDLISEYLPADITANKDLSIITTENRSDEIFFPFSFIDKTKSTPTGLYLYPWLSLPSAGAQAKDEFTKEFKGFTDFFTGSCLFGSTLQGIDDQGHPIPLIKADLQLYPGQKIVKINYEKSLQLHEVTQLQELEKLAALASCITAKEEKSKNSKIYYHLPGYDYLLMGVELYLKGHMTPSAFESFCYIVLKRQATYTKLITQISSKCGIPIIVVSPFTLIFDKLPHLSEKGSKDEVRALAAAVLDIFGIRPLSDAKPQEEREDRLAAKRAQAELAAVLKCTQSIKSKLNPSNPLSIVWNDFIEYAEKPVLSLRDLWHLGNTVMVGVVTYNKALYSVCAFHPVSEKYMFVQYGKYVKHSEKQDNPEWQKKYPVIMCGTIMDEVQPHSKLYAKNRGQTFYYNRRTGSLLNTAIGEQQLKLLEGAGVNVAAQDGSCKPHILPPAISVGMKR
jgi:hypothetical protein